MDEDHKDDDLEGDMGDAEKPADGAEMSDAGGDDDDGEEDAM